MGDIERRQSVRVKKALYFQYLVEDNAEEQFWATGLLRDISETGMSFSSDKNFFPGQIICVRIKVPFNPFEWIEFKGKCLDAKGLSVGIYIIRMHFGSLREEQKKAIKDYLAWAIDKESKDK